jgi:hypothetical protein
LTTKISLATLQLSSTQIRLQQHTTGDEFNGGNSVIQLVSLLWIHKNEFRKDGFAGVSKKYEARPPWG